MCPATWQDELIIFNLNICGQDEESGLVGGLPTYVQNSEDPNGDNYKIPGEECCLGANDPNCWLSDGPSYLCGDTNLSLDGQGFAHYIGTDCTKSCY